MTERNVARIDTVYFSGMWSVARKATVLGRIEALLLATKQARMAANDTEAATDKFADSIFKMLFA